MQASTAPCSLHHSAETSHAQSASQTRPKRQAKLSSSFPIPPITCAIGGAVINELGCNQASSSIKSNFCCLQGKPDAQYYDQSFITSLQPSFTLIQKCIASYIRSKPATGDALPTLNILSQQTTQSANDHRTSSHEIDLNACHSYVRNISCSTSNECDTMTSTIHPLETTPELTDSRSSKSSSCGSDFSTERDVAPEIADVNFEDIGLDDDDNQHLTRVQHGQPQIKTSTIRDTYNARRPTLHKAQYQSKPRATEGPPRSSIVGVMKRGFTSPSVMTVDTQVSQPRTTSPPRRLPRSTSTYSIDIAGSVASTSPRSSLAPSRRGSWQPQRKTIKELEAECQDSDDELPEDTNLWNVPISPFHSTGTSPRSSIRSTTEHDVSAQTLQPLPLDHVQPKPETTIKKNTFSPTPRHKFPPRSSSVNPAHSNPSSPKVPSYLRNARAKSWTNAMSELSPEARVISENLEYHASQRPNGQEGTASQSGASSERSDPNAIKLPPIQRGTLDFMPISKEKEAVLSRTRPSWLPPKDPKEEQRHLKQYQKMMAASMEAQKKKEHQQKSIQSQKETIQASLNRIWDYYIEPTTDITVIDRRVHELCWQGIPARVRGNVWQKVVGNSLGINVKTYQKALDRAKDVKSRKSEDLGQTERLIVSWFADIDRDAETAFPELGLFQRDGLMWHELKDLCEAYACYRSDTGYFYGVQLIAALVLVQVPEPSEAFIFMANCLSKPIPAAFHGGDVASMQRTYNRIVANLGVKFPRLHDYLFEPMERGGLGFTGQEVFEPMLKTLFANGLDLDRLSRAWDIWVFEGDRTLVRIAVAVLGGLQSQIFDVSGDLSLKRRNVQEMLGWGPFNRSGKGAYWGLDSLGGEEAFVDEINAAGKLDYTGR